MYNLLVLWPKVAFAANEFCNSSGVPVNAPDPNNPMINTALGCIPVDFNKFVEWLIPSLLGIAGGVAFLLMVWGFVNYATSGGDPKKAAGAKDDITSAIKGLLVCIFGLFIVRLIAFDILRIPGLNK